MLFSVIFCQTLTRCAWRKMPLYQHEDIFTPFSVLSENIDFIIPLWENFMRFFHPTAKIPPGSFSLYSNCNTISVIFCYFLSDINTVCMKENAIISAWRYIHTFQCSFRKHRLYYSPVGKLYAILPSHS